KVTQFLKLLEQDEMIVYKSDTKKTVINICNYNVYHDYTNGENDTKTTRKHHESDTKTHNQECKRMSKNVKEHIPYAEIVEYLNKRTGKNFKHTAQKTKKDIQARWNEGHSLDDFKKVIDVCSNKWSGQVFTNGQKGDSYLRPSTLFN